MGLLSTVRSFLKPIVNNPIKAGILAYLVVKLIKRHTNIESFSEDIKVINKQGPFEIIFDTETKTYAVIDGRGVHNDFIPVKDINEAKKKIKELSSSKNSYQSEKVKFREKLNKLHR